MRPRLSMRAGVRAVAAAFLICTVPAPSSEAAEQSGALAFRVPAINAGLPGAGKPIQRDSPRAAMETFLDTIDRNDYARAAHILNLNHLPTDRQAERAAGLALKLAFLLRRYGLVDWANLPDQPDARVLPNSANQTPPYKRRTVTLGEVKTGSDPAVPIALQRFQPEDGAAAWLFSPYAVTRIDALYRSTGDDSLRAWIPFVEDHPSLEERVDMVGEPSLWEWTAVAVFLLIAIVVWVIAYYATRLLTLAVPRRWRHLVPRGAPLAATMIAAAVFRIATDRLMLTGPVTVYLGGTATFIAVLAGVWLIVRLLGDVSLAVSQRYIVPLGQDRPDNRKLKTQVYVIRRTAMAVIGLAGLGYVLSEALVASGLFDDIGLSLLASAGAAGVLVAIAARPMLGNVVSGLQIALTDPVRVGDVVVFDETWSVVEDITFSYVVLRTWTDTRLIVPHVELLSKPFENWSKGGEAVTRIVALPVDYRADVGIIREHAAEAVADDADWTGDPVHVEMVEVSVDRALLWIWIAGVDSRASWRLHNKVREHLMAFLRDHETGAWLPRRRIVMADDAPDGPESLEHIAGSREATAEP